MFSDDPTPFETRLAARLRRGSYSYTESLEEYWQERWQELTDLSEAELAELYGAEAQDLAAARRLNTVLGNAPLPVPTFVPWQSQAVDPWQRAIVACAVASITFHSLLLSLQVPVTAPSASEERKLIVVEAVRKQVPPVQRKPKPPEPKPEAPRTRTAPPPSAPQKAFASRTIASTKTDTASQATVSSNQIAGSRGNGIGTDAGLSAAGTADKGVLDEAAPARAKEAEAAAPPPPPPPPVPAKPKGAVQPEYPEIAQQNGWEGKVVVRAHVTETGEVDEATVSSSSGHVELDEAAVAAVRRTKFEPGTREGKPAATWVRVPVIFSLQ